jgi:hypothetical protein
MVADPDSSAHGVRLLLNLSTLATLLLLCTCRQRMAAAAGLSGRAIMWVRGHLSQRPDPWLEARLREAFAEIDRDLAVILHDRRRSY